MGTLSQKFWYRSNRIEWLRIKTSY